MAKYRLIERKVTPFGDRKEIKAMMYPSML